MGVDGRTLMLHDSDTTGQDWAISLHAFSDLRNVSPLMFLFLLKECYVHGTCKATAKFVALQHRVHQVLHNTPRPGPATFIAHCLYVLPIFESYCEGLSHLILSSLRRFLNTGTTEDDLLGAKFVGTRVFVDAVRGYRSYDERVLVKILKVFDIKLTNIVEVISNSDMKNDSWSNKAKAFLELYIFELIESGSYLTAVSMLEHFSISHLGQPFLLKMMESKEYRAAEKWAEFMGKPMQCVLIQEYIDRNLFKHAYDVVKKNNLREEFPEVYHKGKESTLKKLAEKGCWEVAESRAKSDKQLLEYLVYLAMEAGYSEKVDELCDKYSLNGFCNAKDVQAKLLHIRYLHLDELAINDIIWVDEANGLQEATSHIERFKVVGLDCEWKPNYIKGSKPNKVSIMQIATEKMVFILDLIKLSHHIPDILDKCLARILHSPRILKLGYNFQCDVKQLVQSFGDMECFKQYEMLLDIQNVFKETRGGLSGLTKKILGVGLNKTRRNSDWEQRPLSQNQLEYAALDAAVLIHIFWHVRSNPHLPDGSDSSTQIEWKSQIVSHNDNLNSKKKATDKKELAHSGIDEPYQFS